MMWYVNNVECVILEVMIGRTFLIRKSVFYMPKFTVGFIREETQKIVIEASDLNEARAVAKYWWYDNELRMVLNLNDWRFEYVEDYNEET